MTNADKLILGLQLIMANCKKVDIGTNCQDDFLVYTEGNKMLATNAMYLKDLGWEQLNDDTWAFFTLQ